MFRDRDEELKRLEQALLEDEDEEREEDTEDEDYEEDLEEDFEDEDYEEERPRRGTSCLSVLALILMTAIVFMLLLFTLRIRGIL